MPIKHALCRKSNMIVLSGQSRLLLTTEVSYNLLGSNG